MSTGRFILSVVVAFVIYSVFYMGLMAFLFLDVYLSNAHMFRPEAEGMAMYGMLGHLVQTIIVVALFNMAVASNSIKTGAKFGLLVGGYLAATDFTMYMGLKMSLTPLPYSIVIHLAVGMIVGVVLAKLYVPSGEAASADA